MKLVFERETYAEILNDIAQVLGAARPKNISESVSEKEVLGSGINPPAEKVSGPAQGPGPDAPSEAAQPQRPIDPKAKTTKAKAAKGKAAKGKAAPEAEDAPETEAETAPETEAEAEAPEAEAADEIVTPAQLAAIRQKTIDDLQQAYANGQQKEVFALLSKYGNGAKSFRELKADAFVPIRKAIDAGALA